MADQFLDVPDRIELRQVHGTLLVGRRMDETLIPVLVDSTGQLLVASGPGNDYSAMAENYLLVPDRIDLKQVHGTLLVGRKVDGTLVPVAVDDNGRIITSGGGGGGNNVIYWEDTGPTPSGPPPDTSIAWEVRFRDGWPPVVWDPADQAWH